MGQMSLNDALVVATERIEMVAKATQDVIWDWDLVADTIWWSERFSTLFGYQLEHIEPGPESWYNRIHPNDRERVLGGIHAIIDQGGTQWTDEYRFRYADGSYVHVLDRGFILHRESRAVRMVGSMQDITERVRLREEKQETDERYRVALTATGLGTWDLDPFTGRLHWDDRCRELFGLPPGSPVSLDLFWAGLHPDDRAQTEEAMGRSLDSGSEGTFEVVYRTVGLVDRRLRWVRATGKAYFNEVGTAVRFIGTVQDITGQVEANQQVAVAEEHLHRAVELAQLGTWSLDVPSQTLTISPRFGEWFGLAQPTISQPELLSYLNPEEQQRVANAIARALEPGSDALFSIEFTVVHPRTGEERVIRAQGITLFNEQGNARGLSGTAQDVTLQKQTQQVLEQQVQKRTEELERANSLLRQSNEQLEQYAYVASHDLQEPLRKIRIFSELITTLGTLPNEARPLLGRVIQASERMSELIKGLLDFSRLLRADEIIYATNLDEVLQQVLTDFDLLIAEKDAQVCVGQLPTIEAVPLQMNQLLYNLLGNALKFTKVRETNAGYRPKITVQGRLLVPEELAGLQLADPSLPHWEVTVTDNGIGFNMLYADRIFGIFKRLHGGSIYPGPGIGLALCQRIVHNHQGLLFAESEEGRGSVFRVILPLTQPTTRVA